MKKINWSILLVIIFVLSTNACGQVKWERIRPFPSKINTVYFLPDQSEIGFVGLESGAVWRTSDAGLTWNETLSTSQAAIQDFTFKDKSIGWCVNFKQCFRTTDSGKTWIALSIPSTINKPTSKITSTHYGSGSNLLLISCWDPDGIFSSSDEGFTWTQTDNRRATNGYAFMDDFRGISSHLTSTLVNGAALATGDGGLSWYPIPLSQEIWQPVAVKGTPMFFAIAEVVDSVYASVDYGQTWRAVSGLTWKPTGTVGVGYCNTLYAQSTEGFYYSSDGGVSWNPTGGPGSTEDSRFAISQGVLFAGDNYLWRGTPHEPFILSSDSIDFNVVPRCSQKEQTITITNPYCESISIDSFWIAGSPAFSISSPTKQNILVGGYSKINFTIRYTPNNISLENALLHLRIKGPSQTYDTVLILYGSGSLDNRLAIGNFTVKDVQLCSQAAFSVTIDNPSCDTVVVDSSWFAKFDAFSLQSQINKLNIQPLGTLIIALNFIPTTSGLYSDTLHLQFKRMGILIDTFTILQVNVVQNPNALTLKDTQLSFGQVGTCEEVLRTTFLTSPCDSLFIVPTVTVSAPFTLLQPAAGVWLAPGDSLPVTIRCSSTIPGKYSGSVVFESKVSNTTSTVQLNVEGEIMQSKTALTITPGILSFDSVWCNSADTEYLTIQTQGICDSVDLDIIQLTDRVNFTPIPASLPKKLGPSDTIEVPFVYHPTSEGDHATDIHVRYSIRGNVIDTVTHATGFQKGGKGELLSNLSKIDFGEASACAEQDTILTITNIGCDTLTITSIGQSGRGFDVGGISIPIILPPDSSKQISISTSVDTAGGASANIDSLEMTSDAFNQVQAIILTRRIQYPRQYALIVDALPDASNGEVVRVKIRLQPAFDNVATPTRLDFSLNYNTDLLDYLRTEGPNTGTSDGQKFTFTGNSQLIQRPDGTVGEILFRAMLTTDSTTPVTIQHVKLNSNDPDYEKCVAAITGAESEFNYAYSCSERTIARYLQTNALEILSIHPNPSTEDVTIEIRSDLTREAKIEIYDIGGRLITTSATFAKRITLPIQSFRAGSYIARVSAGSEVRSRPFVVEK